MIQICVFKKKGKERGEAKPQLDGQWKVPNLVASKCSMFGVQWGSILFGGQWEVPSSAVNGEASCLVANERFQCLVGIGRFQAWWPLGGKKNIPFTFFHFSHHKILFKLFFSLILKFYFIMALDHYFVFFFFFLDLYITIMHLEIPSFLRIHH